MFSTFLLPIYHFLLNFSDNLFYNINYASILLYNYTRNWLLIFFLNMIICLAFMYLLIQLIWFFTLTRLTTTKIKHFCLFCTIFAISNSISLLLFAFLSTSSSFNDLFFSEILFMYLVWWRNKTYTTYTNSILTLKIVIVIN